MTTVAPVVQSSEVAERARLDDRRRLALSLVLVGLVALAVAWLGDPRAASFSDAGGRLATVKTMADTAPGCRTSATGPRGRPGGVHHPILFTCPHGDRWVEVTSLPLVVVGRAALAARRCSCRRADPGPQRRARRLRGAPAVAVGVGRRRMAGALVRRAALARRSSTAPTSGSTRPALALALLALALVLEGGGRRVVIGGLLAGLAIVMRNDMLITFVALGVAALLVVAEERTALRSRRWRELLVAGAARAFAVLVANAHRVARAVRAPRRARCAPPNATVAGSASRRAGSRRRRSPRSACSRTSIGSR